MLTTVQLIPSGLVIVLAVVVPENPTATNKLFANIILLKPILPLVGYDGTVQLIPFGLVIILYAAPGPPLPTATNFPLPYAIPAKAVPLTSIVDERKVQGGKPFGVVITLLIPPVLATATNNPFPDKSFPYVIHLQLRVLPGVL